MITISEYTIPDYFITESGEMVYEKEVERTFSRLCIDSYPDKATYSKSRLGTGITDGIIKFYKGKDLKGWILQECKRDEGPTIVHMARAFLQSMMYLGEVFYDFSIYDVNKFKGIILDSTRYFCSISDKEINKIKSEFEPLYKKYYAKVAPNEAYKVDELDDWAIKTVMKLNKNIYRLDDKLRLDIIIQDLLR